MAKNVKNMLKRTGTHGATFSISKTVDFIGAEPFGSAFFLCIRHPRLDRGSSLY